MRVCVRVARVHTRKHHGKCVLSVCSLNFKRYLLDRLHAGRERCGKQIGESSGIHKGIQTEEGAFMRQNTEMYKMHSL